MPPTTLFRYVGQQALLGVVSALLIFSSIVLLIDFIENLRFVSKFPDGTFQLAMSLALLRAPWLIQTVIPFVFLFGAIWTFYQLNRRSELSVMRSAGLSIWRLLGPAALIAAFSGVLLITVVDPVSSNLLSYAEQLKNVKIGKDRNLMRVFDDGLWLRQRDATMQILINAKSLDRNGGVLKDVSVWRFNANNQFIERIDAPEAVLSGRTMELRDAQLTSIADKTARKAPVYAIRTTLTADDLRERVSQPETISLWELPHFILLAESAGLPTARYHIRFHDLCSTPLKLLAMVLIAGALAFRPFRSGGVIYLIAISIAAGFLLYLLSEISKAMGESGLVPVALAAWTPALVASLVAVTALLHFEDG